MTRGRISRLGGALAVVAALGIVLVLVGREGWPGLVSGCIAAGDCSCEAIRSGLVAQPTNSASSLALVLCGLAIVWIGAPRGGDGQERMQPIAGSIFGFVVIASGLGSLVFHASITEWGGWADLVGAAAVLVFVVVYRSVPKLSPHRFLAANAIGVGAAAGTLWIVGTGSGKYVLYGLAVFAAGAEWRALRKRSGRIRREWRWISAGVSLFVVGAVIWWSARTGHSLCAQDSVWQWHAMWHVLVAAALGALFMHWRNEVSHVAEGQSGRA